MVCAALWEYGPIGLNGTTAVLSALGSAFFVLALRKLRVRNYLIAGFTLAFTPIVWIHSTDLMDYVWALCFITASLYCVVSKRWMVAAGLLALAIGCRLTSAAMIVPLSFFVFRRENKAGPPLLFSATSVLLGVATYIPAIGVHRGYLFTVWDYGYPKLHTILFMFSVQVWGFVGALSIGGVLAYHLVCAIRSPLERPSYHFVAPSVCAILIYTIVFLKLPHEPGYLIPIVPFVILLLSDLLSEKMFAVTCVCIIGSSAVSGTHQKLRIAGDVTDSSVSMSVTIRGIDLVLDLLYGPVLYDAIRRRATINMVDRVVELSRTDTAKVVYVTGELLAQIDHRGLDSENRAIFEKTLDEKKNKRYRDESYLIYYLEDIAIRYNRALTGLDLVEEGARFVGEHPRF